ncbi:MAG: HIT family protein [Candidatus Shapirobacteria bacterium]|nr:HIT family protein [Candidatus Shapirobacteria bacterium]MDD4410127.1 HIT family protein [Candidatus Shapirobacteria bacterium]
MDKNCFVCDRIELIKENKNPYFVKEMKTGYVVIGDYQFYKGYTLFICKEHKKELHELEPKFRKLFLEEMSEVAEAVYKAFKPNKLNYELLGNTVCHMHWHLIPRYKDDQKADTAIWVIDKSVRCSEKVKATPEQIQEYKKLLLKYLK